MTEDSMKLPGSEDETNEEIMELIDKARQEDKFLRVKIDGSISKKQYAYATKIYDVDLQQIEGLEESETDEVFVLVTEEGFKRANFMNAQVLHDFLLKQYEAEILDLDELPRNEDNHDTNWWEKMQNWQEKQNPMNHVYVFIRHTDDGRYKDEWKLYRGESEEQIRKEKGKPRPENEEEKYVYICLGTVKEVINNTEELAQEYSFDRKQGGGRSIPIDLMALLDDNELHDSVEQVMDNEE